jgi:hypothetical protein
LWSATHRFTCARSKLPTDGTQHPELSSTRLHTRREEIATTGAIIESPSGCNELPNFASATSSCPRVYKDQGPLLDALRKPSEQPSIGAAIGDRELRGRRRKSECRYLLTKPRGLGLLLGGTRQGMLDIWASVREPGATGVAGYGSRRARSRWTLVPRGIAAWMKVRRVPLHSLGSPLRVARLGFE